MHFVLLRLLNKTADQGMLQDRSITAVCRLPSHFQPYSYPY